MMKNPEFCAKANMFFDNAYEIFKQNNEEHAYEKSAQILEKRNFEGADKLAEMLIKPTVRHF